MKHCLKLFFLWLCLAGAVAFAQTNPPPAAALRARPAERFLMIFDTSSAMKRRAPAVQKATRELIVAGMHGQLQSGDRVGVWNFDESLYAGQFPVLVWAPDAKESIATNIVAYLSALKYKNKAQFASILPALTKVVQGSEKITVILFSDGATPMQGSRYDGEINAAYADYRRALKKSETVLVTVLRARRGQLTAWSVNVSPWPVEFPSFPPEPPVVAETRTSATNAPPRPPAKVVAPIVLDMSKKSSPPTTTNSPPAPATANVTTTNVTAVPPADPLPHEPVPIQPPTVTVAAPAASVLVSPLPTPTEAAKTDVAKAEPHPELAPKIAPVTVQPPPPAIPATPAKTTIAQIEPPAQNNAATTSPTSAKEPNPTPKAVESGLKPLVQDAPKPTPPIPTAVVTPETVIAGKRPLVVALALLMAALVLVVMVFIRHRPRQSSSLITRSMDQDQK